jgi:mRNA interferase MazF
MFKRFLEWILLKERLQANNSTPPFVSERDLWWISMGENVGSEINGKSKLFSRPGIIYKKLSHTFYLIIPTTTQKREGSWFIPITINGKQTYACLHQLKTFDYRRLSSRMAQLTPDDFEKVKIGFNLLYK